VKGGEAPGSDEAGSGDAAHLKPFGAIPTASPGDSPAGPAGPGGFRRSLRDYGRFRGRGGRRSRTARTRVGLLSAAQVGDGTHGTRLRGRGGRTADALGLHSATCATSRSRPIRRQ